MAYILGIDTGGTYTDSVIFDSVSGCVIAKAKAFTTHDDLSRGINNSINALDFQDLASLTRVIISTTLATNAIVEGKGHKTGLILIGKKLTEMTPAFSTYNAGGRINPKGRELSPINPDEIINIIRLFHEQEIESIAVCGFLSVRNPIHEAEIEAIIRKHSNMTVVCSHKISADLGFFERAVTTVLNASLMPIIKNFITSIISVLKSHDIGALPYIVKCDGSIAAIDSVRETPIETILSGPVASAIGAMHLSGLKDAIVADMGGTTTDTVLIKDNRVSMSIKGAKVGNWQTMVKSVDVSTYGLGGDSRIDYDDGKFVVGPQRVLPACRMAMDTRDALYVTPTDLLHITGEFREWDYRASQKAASEMAEKTGMDHDKFVLEATNEINRIIYNQCIAPYSKPELPVVAIGAPAGTWFRKAADAGGFKLTIPENFEIANAIGAAIAEIRESVAATIRPGENQHGFIVHFQEERLSFSDLNEAVTYTNAKIRDEAYKKAKIQGAVSVDIIVSKEDTEVNYIDKKGNERSKFVEIKMTAVATGKRISAL